MGAPRFGRYAAARREEGAGFETGDFVMKKKGLGGEGGGGGCRRMTLGLSWVPCLRRTALCYSLPQGLTP